MTRNFALLADVENGIYEDMRRLPDNNGHDFLPDAASLICEHAHDGRGWNIIMTVSGLRYRKNGSLGAVRTERDLLSPAKVAEVIPRLSSLITEYAPGELRIGEDAV